MMINMIYSARETVAIRYWRLFFFVIVAIVILQVAFGSLFYKQKVLGIYPTELTIIIMWIMFLYVSALPMRVPRIPISYSMLLALSLVYGVYSLGYNHPLIWVSRQLAFILYLSVAIVGYVYAKKLERSCRWGVMFSMSGIIGGLALSIHKAFPVVLGPAVLGHTEFTALLLFLLGASYWIVKQKNPFLKMIVGSLCVLFSYLFSDHMSWVAAGITVMLAAFFIQYRKIRIILMFGAIAGLVAAFFWLESFRDANAIWRYLYWKGVIKESWERSFFLLGQGFGITFLPEGDESFESLMDQVKRRALVSQLHTVPPHNGILTILIYLGLPGVILFLYPVWLGVCNALRGCLSLQGQVFLVSISALLVLLASNQFLEVPYTAVLFWLVYGGFLYFGLHGNHLAKRLSNEAAHSQR